MMSYLCPPPPLWELPAVERAAPLDECPLLWVRGALRVPLFCEDFSRTTGGATRIGC